MLSDAHLLRWLIALIGLVFTLGAMVLLAQRYGQNWRKKFGGKLRLVEQMNLDSRYKVVVLEDGESRHTLVLGPQQATSIGKAALTSTTTSTPRKAKKKK
jgi:hypothetical protein